MSGPTDLYRNLLAAVEAGSAAWIFKPAQWRYDKGDVILDSPTKDSRSGITWWTAASARIKLRDRERHNLSVDILWGDSSRSPSRTHAKKFHAFLTAQQNTIDTRIRLRAAKPGIFRIREDTPRANWMIEGGYVLDEGIDILDPKSFDACVEWLLAVIPAARNEFVLAMNGFVRSQVASTGIRQ